jgi:quinol monooxygenase YgiN
VSTSNLRAVSKMIIRQVTFTIDDSSRLAYERLADAELGPVNREFGCDRVYLVTATDDRSCYGILSFWRDVESLAAMRSSDEYRQVLALLRGMVIGDIEDRVWHCRAV